jgi:LacI family transcriptional regulator
MNKVGINMSVSIREVAKIAKVSIATVSRVVNNSATVKDETKKKVLEAIEETGYQPNAIARSLKVSKTHTIGVIIPNIANQFVPGVVRGIEDCASEHGYTIMVCNGDGNDQKEKQYLQILYEKRMDGIIFMSHMISDQVAHKIYSLDIPMVFINTYDPEKKYPRVGIDDTKAAYDAVAYLLQQGHRKIAMIGGFPKDPIASRPRWNGYKKALEQFGVPYDEDLITWGNFSAEEGYRLVHEYYVKKNKIPTAMFCASDTIAIGAMRAWQEIGYRIPEDISVVGFDNISLSPFLMPPLTTVAQPFYHMGESSMRLLLSQIHGEKIKKKNIIVPHQLILRKSSK